MIKIDTKIIKDLVAIYREHFDNQDITNIKIYNHFAKAIHEDRFMFLYNKDKPIGFLVYYLFNKNEMKECLKDCERLNFPEYNLQGEYIYIDTCIVFNGKDIHQLTYLRRYFKSMFPWIRYVCWYHNRDKDNRKLFMIPYSRRF